MPYESLVQEAHQLITSVTYEKLLFVVNYLKSDMDLPQENLSPKEKSLNTVFGCFQKYAAPELVSKEKDAWTQAVKEKYALH